MIPSEALSECMAIIGRTGAGKSYTARGLAERLLDDGARLCVLDPTGVWWGLRLDRDGKKPSPYPVVIFGGDKADVPINDQAGAVVAKIVAEHRTPCVIDVSDLTYGGRTRFAAEFFDTLYRANRRDPIALIVDEADVFAPQRPMPDQTLMFSRVEQIVRRGRVRGFRPWLITQRPAELHKSVLSQAGTMIALKLTAPQDRKAIEGWVMGHADKAEGAQVLSSLAGLARGEGWVWYPAGDMLARRKFPAIKTFDSMRTPEPGEAEVTLAPLDRGRIGEIVGQIEALAAQAKAEDPKALKAEIARLTRELAAKAGAGASAVEAARQEGYQRGYGAGHEHGAAETRTAILKEADDLIAEIAYDASALHTRLAQAAGRLSATKAPVQRNLDAIKMPSRSAPRTTTNGSGKVHGDLSRPQQRILDALAWLESVGIDRAARTQLAFLADASPKSSAFMNNLSALRTAGLIEYPGEGEVSLTPQGRRAANAAGAPQTTAELQAQVRGKVTAPQWRILEALIRTYPRALDRETLAERAEASPSSSAYVNNLGFLRSLGVIDYPGQGQVRAEPVLFLEERR